MQLGALNEGDARPWKVDHVTLEQIVDFTNRPNVGTKMRFAHPNMSRDGMGRHLGRAKNARIIGTGDDAYAAIDPQVRRRTSEQLQRQARGVSVWSVVQKTADGEAGPLTLDSSPMDATPIGLVTYV